MFISHLAPAGLFLGSVCKQTGIALAFGDTRFTVGCVAPCHESFSEVLKHTLSILRPLHRDWNLQCLEATERNKLLVVIFFPSFFFSGILWVEIFQKLRSSFWDVLGPRLGFVYRCFRTTYRSKPARFCLTLHYPLLAPKSFPKAWGNATTSMHRSTSPNTKDLNCTAREA